MAFISPVLRILPIHKVTTGRKWNELLFELTHNARPQGSAEGGASCRKQAGRITRASHAMQSVHMYLATGHMHWRARSSLRSAKADITMQYSSYPWASQ